MELDCDPRNSLIGSYCDCRRGLMAWTMVTVHGLAAALNVIYEIFYEGL